MLLVMASVFCSDLGNRIGRTAPWVWLAYCWPQPKKAVVHLFSVVETLFNWLPSQFGCPVGFIVIELLAALMRQSHMKILQKSCTHLSSTELS